MNVIAHHKIVWIFSVILFASPGSDVVTFAPVGGIGGLGFGLFVGGLFVGGVFVGGVFVGGVFVGGVFGGGVFAGGVFVGGVFVGGVFVGGMFAGGVFVGGVFVGGVFVGGMFVGGMFVGGVFAGGVFVGGVFVGGMFVGGVFVGGEGDFGISPVFGKFDPVLGCSFCSTGFVSCAFSVFSSFESDLFLNSKYPSEAKEIETATIATIKIIFFFSMV
ncbi:hypothetical protein CWI38_0342p0010 [Hamiltosporidium tvaerminnensis]|uniref:Uncharacterized protein n=1 Tax=Hamiltosporidium tvaerminnensis TaxID=1176355 RepID=A0A4Q9M140_9MICR|nr:hypothetical protein CWI38_0342p0010 [Hamiltosporidium tvaerminnensis]